MTFSNTFGRTFSPTFQPKSQAAVSSASTWWDLNGTITSCVAAYQAKGAASYAASLVNLTGNTDYDATEGNAPDWNVINGWMFNGSNYLETNIIISNTYSMIARYSSANSGLRRLSTVQIGTGASRFGLAPTYYENALKGLWLWGSSYLNSGTLKSSGIDCLANKSCYSDGSYLGDVSATWDGTIDFGCDIGCLKNSLTNRLQFFLGYIQAFAIYNATLTSTQVGNLTTAMAAL